MAVRPGAGRRVCAQIAPLGHRARASKIKRPGCVRAQPGQRPEKESIHENKSSPKKVSAPRAARQAKTVAKNISIIFQEDETNETAAAFEVPQSFFDAMVRDALAKGISLQQWVENAVKKEMAKPLPKAAPPVNGDGEIILALFSERQGTLAQILIAPAEFEVIKRGQFAELFTE